MNKNSLTLKCSDNVTYPAKQRIQFILNDSLFIGVDLSGMNHNQKEHFLIRHYVIRNSNNEWMVDCIEPENANCNLILRAIRIVDAYTNCLVPLPVFDHSVGTNEILIWYEQISDLNIEQKVYERKEQVFELNIMNTRVLMQNFDVHISKFTATNSVFQCLHSAHNSKLILKISSINSYLCFETESINRRVSIDASNQSFIDIKVSDSMKIIKDKTSMINVHGETQFKYKDLSPLIHGYYYYRNDENEAFPYPFSSNLTQVNVFNIGTLFRQVVVVEEEEEEQSVIAEENKVKFEFDPNMSFYEEECVICKDRKCNTRTPCCHHFCYYCLHRQVSIKAECPNCRQDLRNKTIFWCDH